MSGSATKSVASTSSQPSSRAPSAGDVWRSTVRFDGHDERVARVARAAVVEACAGRYDASTVVDIQLVVSELVTNCIEHARADAVRLCLSGVGDRVTVTVASSSSLDGVPHPDSWCLPTSTACSGRGLAMIGRIGCVGLSTTDDGDDAWSAITVSIDSRPR